MQKARILIVEDEELVALAMKTFLDEAGHLETFIVASGDAALEVIPERSPDLVLMDIHIQGSMSGIDAAQLIRDSYHLPVVYITAYSDEETLELAKVTEPYGYILKPFDERSLLATIEMALYRAPVLEQLRHSKEAKENILRSIGDGIIVTGSTGLIDYMNSSAMLLLESHFTPSDTVSILKVCSILDGQTGLPVALHLDKVLFEGKSIALTDCVVITTGKNKFTADINLSPFKGNRDSTRGMVVTIRDVSRRQVVPGLIQRELQNVSNMHRNLLPADGTVIGPYQLHGSMTSATFGGGDVYNFFRIDDRYSGLYMIDVMGHGLAASSMAMLLSRLLVPDATAGDRFPFLDADPRKPGRVVARLNDLFFSSGLLFFTVCYAVIDNTTHRLLMARAGHPRPLLLNRQGKLDEIEGGGIAIGLDRNLRYEEFPVDLGEGDRLFMYTDGLIECVNEKHEPLGLDRFRKLVASTIKLNPETALASIWKVLEKWKAKSTYDDDLSLIVLHRTTPGVSR